MVLLTVAAAALLGLGGVLLSRSPYTRVAAAHALPVPVPAPAATFSSAAVPTTSPASPPKRTTAVRSVRTRDRSAPRPPTTDRVVIPALTLSAPLIPEAIKSGGLVIPPPAVVGWWTGGASIDAGRSEQGTTLLAAHVNLDGAQGAFAQLYRAKYGEVVYLDDLHGRRSRWAVVAVQTVKKAQLPATIFARTGRRQLVLVTCTGRLLTARDGTRSYDSNLIVTALPY